MLYSRVLGFQRYHASSSMRRREFLRRASASSQHQNTDASKSVQNPLTKRRIHLGGPTYNEFMKEGGWIQHGGTLKRLDLEALGGHQQGKTVPSDKAATSNYGAATTTEKWYCIVPKRVVQNEIVPLDEDQSRLLNEQLLFVNKPSGMNCVPARDPSIDSLSSEISSMYGKNAKPCHRLDRDTSGIVVFGLSEDAHRNVSKQFEARTTCKTYVALIAGHPENDHGLIDLPIGKIKTEEGFSRWTIGGDKPRQAITDWHVDKRFTIANGAKFSRVQLSPKTGRGHQLRLHMKAMGHPILGDTIHGEGAVASCSPRLCLHAHKLQLDWNGSLLHAESVAPF